MGDGLSLDYLVAGWPGRGQPCSAIDLVGTGARLVRAIRGIFVLCLAMATHVPVEKL
jgi:hypothetical protein